MTLTAGRLRELLHYDPETGVFTRLVRTSNRVQVGDIAGTVVINGYAYICVEGCQHSSHRLAYLYMTGEWPAHQIDHKNTIRSDNRWDNLRHATSGQNGQNLRKARSDNRCGLLGVSPNKNRWQAQIKANGRHMHIGTFDTPELAHAAYLEAKARLHPFQTLVVAAEVDI